MEGLRLRDHLRVELEVHAQLGLAEDHELDLRLGHAHDLVDAVDLVLGRDVRTVEEVGAPNVAQEVIAS
jgi:hypothetical protein